MQAQYGNLKAGLICLALGALFAILTLLAGCAASNGYVGFNGAGKASRLSAGMDAIIGSIYKLRTQTIFVKSDGVEETVKSQGIGLAIASGKCATDWTGACPGGWEEPARPTDLILALDHVVTDYELTFATPFGMVALPAEKLRETTYLVGQAGLGGQAPVRTGAAIIPGSSVGAHRDAPRAVREPPLHNNGLKVVLKTLMRDRESDIALFRIGDDPCRGLIYQTPLGMINHAPTRGSSDVPQNDIVGNCLRPLSIPFGRSADLKVGDIVYVIGSPFNLGLNVRAGIVSALTMPALPGNMGVNPDNAFMVSNGLVPGDSGGPVLAIQDGNFEIVGLAQSVVAGAPNLGVAIKIDFVLEKLKDYLGKPGQARAPILLGESFSQISLKTFERDLVGQAPSPVHR